MSEPTKSLSCQLGCWGLAAAAGLLTLVLLLVLGGYGWPGAIFLGVLAFIVLGVIFSLLFCRPLPQMGAAHKSDGADAAHGSASAEAAGTAPAASSAAATASPASASASSAPAANATAPAGAGIKPSAPLAGQAELAERKGTWKYESETASGGTAQQGAATAAPASAAAEQTPDYDGDGVHEGTDEGTKPAALDGPRGGQADDLKQIKGIGPKLEQLCNALGFYHFDQIAGWSADEVAWVDANLKGFKGRVSRDTWVEQAKVLASGGETEFSKRVEDGGVY